MTKKEFMEKVIAMIEKTEIVDEEVMVEFAHNEIEKIDRDNVIVDLDQVHHAIGFSIVHVRAISCW